MDASTQSPRNLSWMGSRSTPTIFSLQLISSIAVHHYFSMKTENISLLTVWGTLAG
jgi:hypothetical protein